MKRAWTVVGVGLVVLALLTAGIWWAVDWGNADAGRLIKKEGFIDRTGEFVIEPQFNVAGDFREGLAVVATAGPDTKHPEHEHRIYTYGYIDRMGTYVIPPQFNSEVLSPSLLEFRNGTAIVEQDFKIYRIDRMGRIIEEIDPGTEWSDPGRDLGAGLVRISEGRLKGIATLDGTVVVPPTYQAIHRFSEGLAAAQLDGKYGYIDATGHVVVDFQFDNARAFSDGLAAVNVGTRPDGRGQPVGGTWGFIDRTSLFAVPPTFANVHDFQRDHALANMGAYPGRAGFLVGGKWGLIDGTGAWLAEPQYDLARNAGEGMVLVNVGARLDLKGNYQHGGKWGYLGPDGSVVVEPLYDYAFDFHEGLASVFVDGKGGCVDTNGNIVIPLRFKHIGSFSEGLAVAAVEGRLDSNGRFEWRSPRE